MFVFITKSNSSSVISRIELRLWMPAFAKSALMLPYSFSAVATAASVSVYERVSAWMKSAPVSRASCSASLSLMSVKAAFHPALRKRATVAAPMPVAPPVMNMAGVIIRFFSNGTICRPDEF